MEDPASIEEGIDAEFALQEAVRESLKYSQKREVCITVHGIKNTFENAVLRSAELWHFFGRDGAVVTYTWPAGHPGLVDGYHYDAVSSIYTVYHFKQMIHAITKMPDVDRIDIIAHSRGTGVVSEALRELCIAGFQQETGGAIIGDVVYIAADLDWDTILQRDLPERVFKTVDSISVYMYRDDLALALSKFLWKSSRRVGQLRLDDLGPDEKELLRLSGKFNLIDVQVQVGGIGHMVITHSRRFRQTLCSCSEMGEMLAGNMVGP